ncbi:LAME_0F01046g1_1 [Lachancea meyersii CBS 8951]|uniref:LAME_0F01046g1_1 n=1 Tax=Lachancea meyersii CBS 8951 TaxID=1266667 RepID=A0A1G4JPL9_9SACH|nr:LAME_0F01046g1_1 [Lachancea meyersii CBS 8951]
MIAYRPNFVSVLLCLAWLSQYANSLPLLDQQAKRQIITRMHTASTTNMVTDFYSTTTQVEVAPTVEFIISGDTTITTTLPLADGATPTGSPTTTVMLTVSVQNNIAAEPTTSSTDCATTITNGSPKGTVYVSPIQASSVNSSPQTQENTATTYSSSALVASASVLPSSQTQQNTATIYPTSVLVASSSVLPSSQNQRSTQSTYSSSVLVGSASVLPTSSATSVSTSSSTSLSSTERADAPSAHLPAPPASTTSSFSVTSIQPTTSTTSANEQSSSTTQQQTSSFTTQAETSSTSQTSTSSTSYSTSSGGLTSAPTALVYSPYNDDNSCKDSSSVYQDLEFIKSKGVSKIRVYGTDCNSLETVTSAAKSLGITINQGLWITSSGVDSIDDSVTALISYGQSNGWDLFDVLTIGNEAILSGYCTVSDLINKISSVRSQFENAGFNGQFTTSEPPVTFQNHPELCTSAKIDFVGINSHAYFDENSSAASAGTFVKGQFELIQQICGTNNVVVTETGYPSDGDQNGGNIPSAENQLTAVQNILNEMGQQVTILSTFDDLWKQPGPYNIENHFGISSILPNA